MLPGGFRIVEQTGYQAVAGATGKLYDGTLVTTGYYGVAGAGLRESTLRAFSVQSQQVFRKYSNIALTSANNLFADVRDRKSNTSELQSLMRRSDSAFCLKKKKQQTT